MKVILNAVISALVLGASGFILGFIGPIVFAPGANQGPLLGIFITGPAGLILGGLIGAAVGVLKQQNETREPGSRLSRIPKIWNRILAASVVLAGLVMIASSIYSPWHAKNYSPSVRSSSDIQDRTKTLTTLNVRFLSDSDIPMLEKFSELRTLDFYSGWGRGKAEITDTGLKALSELHLPELKQLRLGQCSKISDAGLLHLAGMKTLKLLNLTGCTQITDDGLRKLSASTSLRQLGLQGCDGITDRGLVHLYKMTKLEELWLGGAGNVTAAGVDELRKVLPNCRISTWAARKS